MLKLFTEDTPRVYTIIGVPAPALAPRVTDGIDGADVVHYENGLEKRRQPMLFTWRRIGGDLVAFDESWTERARVPVGTMSDKSVRNIIKIATRVHVFLRLGRSPDRR